MTTDRVAGIGLALFTAVILEESWRSKLPVGSVAMPGPAYVPAVLAVALLVSGAIIAAQGAGAPRLGAVGWQEWRHAAAIVGVCAFMAPQSPGDDSARPRARDRGPRSGAPEGRPAVTCVVEFWASWRF